MKTLKIIICGCLFLSGIFYSSKANAEPQEPKYYKGMLCKKDCGGHKAGYEWATKYGVTSNEACENKSDSFKEGCQKAREETLKKLKEQFQQEFSKELSENQK